MFTDLLVGDHWIGMDRLWLIYSRDWSRLAQALNEEVNHRSLLMLHCSLWENDYRPGSLEGRIQRLDRNPVLRAELLEVLEVLLGRIHNLTPSAQLPLPCPLHLYALYTRDEILAALGYWTLRERPEMREGVLYVPQIPADVFFSTLNKTEREFSPTTMYADYAISDTLFHWQSQSTTSENSLTGQRYIEHEHRRHQILLFVREDKKSNGLACPYHFLGPATYVDHSGSRPIASPGACTIPCRLIYCGRPADWQSPSCRFEFK